MTCSPKLILLVALFVAVATAAPSVKDDSAKELKQKLPVTEDEVVIVQRRTPNYGRSRGHATPCNSTKTNNSFPAAHIIGFSELWSTQDPSNEAYRNTHWRCDRESAFVDGGMIFRQDNKKLYVPECGYYYVSSQVQFGQYTAGKPSIYAQHQLFVETNCPHGSREIRTNAYATTDTTEWVATTFTGRLFKICAGGTIYVKIPTGSNRACCPYGKRDGTFFSAHLVRALNCNQ
ncbi:uncharacterized protein LOC135341455 [Halichondria panicea]|uniref:uncharacterized protein LOC135341455 n=1 Tax=Halichondria panicea TaxID=6063 RepID=UPI00312B56F1